MLKSHERFHSANGKRKILVADDEMINREILREILQGDYEVLLAEDGQQTLDIMRKFRNALSLVLLDLRMPVMDGREAARRIRALDDPTRANVPIIAAAANVFADDVQANLDAGMDAFVAKPLDVAKLLSTLAQFVEHR